MAKLGPGMLMTNKYMAHIVERVSLTYPDLGEIRKKVVIENEASSFGLLKENLIVRVLDETSRE